MASRAGSSQRRPTRLASARPTRPSPGLIDNSRRALTGSSIPLMCSHSGSASTTVCSTSRASPRPGAPRIHPLGEPDCLACRGVSHCARTDLIGDHQTRIQPHAQPQIHTVATSHRAASRLTSSWIAGAARHPRKAASSNATGAPNSAITPSPLIPRSRRSGAPPLPSAPPTRS